MKDYIQKIIRVFTASAHDEKVTNEVHQWLLDEVHADEKESALHAIWKETEGRADLSTWKSLSNVYSKIGIKNGSKENVSHMKIWQYASAAVAVVAVSILGTYLFTKNLYSEVAVVEKFTPAGEMDTIELPDGSKVQTNSETLLLYPENFEGDTRTVYLVGEANFKVKKDPNKPFIVKSRTMAVTALGTEFNVSAYPDDNELIATLIHGKVKVACNNGTDHYILNPAQQVVYQFNTKKSILAEANLETVTAWQKGLFIYQGATMKEILSSLERYYAITFQYNTNLFNGDKYNFRFREKSKVEDVMAILQEVVGGFDFKIDKDICYIKAIK